MAFKVIPKDWKLSPELREWTEAKGFSDERITEELESFRDHDYRVAKTRPDACWRNWVKNSIKWGKDSNKKQTYAEKLAASIAEIIE
jgi:hypothetical protein